LLLATVVAAAPACKGKKTDEQATAAASATATDTPAESSDFKPYVQISFTPTPAQHERADEVAAKVSSKWWDLPRSFKLEKGDGEVAVILAASNTQLPVIGAALKLLATAKPGAEPTPDQLAVILHHLKASDSRIVTRAVQAAKPFLNGRQPHAELYEAVLTAGRSPAFKAGRERYWLLDTLESVSLRKRGEGQQFIDESVKAPENYVAIKALDLLYNPKLPVRSDKHLTELGLSALYSDVGGARGLGARILGRFGGDDASVPPKLLGMLQDKEPYVRSQAAMALAALKYKPALHELGKLTGDMANNAFHYDVVTYERPIPKVLTGSQWPLVAAAALEAIDLLAGPELKLEPVKPNDVEGSIKARAAAFEKWYAANKSKIEPAPEPEIVKPQNTIAGAAAADKAAKGKPSKATAPKAPKPTDKPAAAPKE
jgi:HEAT repeat protein